MLCCCIAGGLGPQSWCTEPCADTEADRCRWTCVRSIQTSSPGCTMSEPGSHYQMASAPRLAGPGSTVWGSTRTRQPAAGAGPLLTAAQRVFNKASGRLCRPCCPHAACFTSAGMCAGCCIISCHSWAAFALPAACCLSAMAEGPAGQSLASSMLTAFLAPTCAFKNVARP